VAALSPPKRSTSGDSPALAIDADVRHLLAALKRAHRDGWAARDMRRLAERVLRLLWILELAQADAADDRLRTEFQLEVRALYRDRARRRALNVFLQCRDGGACCRLEGLDATAARLSGAACASIDHDSYTALRAAGGEIVLPDGGLVP